MALLDRGLTSDTFTIDAVDVSSRAVERTRSGVFRANSFRGDDLDYRTRYFIRTPEGFWRLRDAAKESVRVRQSNMLAPDFLSDELPFDIVFCRNLLIYLHAGAKAAVMNNVQAAARARRSSCGRSRRGGHRAGPRPGPMALRRVRLRVHVGRHAAPKPARLRACRPAAPLGDPPLRGRDAGRAAATCWLQPQPAAATEEEPTLKRARRLADAGQLQEAIRICAEYLKRAPDSPRPTF